MQQEAEVIALRFYEAVIANDSYEVQDILSQNSLSNNKISIRIITGVLLIAIEKQLIDVAKVILEYNSINGEKISSYHLDAILCIAAKLNILKELGIIYN